MPKALRRVSHQIVVTFDVDVDAYTVAAKSQATMDV